MKRQEFVARRPVSEDFEGKKIARFERTSDDMWRIAFSDGTGLTIECSVERDNYGTFGRAHMEITGVW